MLQHMRSQLTVLSSCCGLMLGLSLETGPVFAQTPLDPMTIPKYTQPLVNPPAMPPTTQTTLRGIGSVDYYEIGVRQFSQQVLPPGFPVTTVWGYGSINHPGTFNYPGFTIEAKWNRPVAVRWVNELVDANGGFLPHLLPVDPTLHWANPPGGEEGRDSTPPFITTPGPYTGPVPIVTHLHGASTGAESDGFTEAWYLPAANNIPPGYASVGSSYDSFMAESESLFGWAWTPGSATFFYPNRQPAGTLWYHDHTLGMTRLNVYAGLAGFYLLRGGPNDLRAQLPSAPYEIPIAIQDRSFWDNGALRYPSSRAEFDGFNGPFIPESDMPPIWNPEFFGDTIVVNGRTWPTLTAEARRYRLRLLNGCDSRFLILKVVTDPLAERPQTPALPLIQIGTDLGYLPAPVARPEIVLGPGERADVILDLSGVNPGQTLYLINEGPDEPYGGGTPGIDFHAANPLTTGQVMRIVVSPPSSRDRTLPPSRLRLPADVDRNSPTAVRRVALLEMDSDVLPGVGPRMAMLGTIDEEGNVIEHTWDEPPTEIIRAGTTEIWEIYNLTMDAHPIHLHEVGFRVIDRREVMTSDADPAPAWELGRKDTVIAFPDQVTRIRATFNRAGRFVWHCHILSHEDNEMMRPLLIVP